MKIGLDCRLSGFAHAGIGRYIKNLIQRLPQLAPDIEWVYFYRQADQVIPNVEARVHFVPVRHYTLREQLQLPFLFAREKLDLLHIPHFNAPIFYPGKIVVTIHDLLWHQQKGVEVTTLEPWEYWPKYLAYRGVTTASIIRAQTILVPTQTIKNTLAQHYPSSAKKIVVTREGVDEQLLAAQTRRVKKKAKQLLYVGSLYPHKNIKLVLNALKQLPRWKLTIAGSRNIFQDQVRAQVKQLQLQNQVEFAGYLTDQELAHVIKASAALVQPSLSEGFGLTGVEAMALGTPVVASNIPVFRETYQTAAHYFDPSSPDSFIQALKDLTQSPVARKDLAAVATQYSWDKMAQQTIQAYRHALGEK